MLYLAVITWKRLGSMNITATSQPFFQDLRPLVEIGTLEATSIDFWLVVLDVLSYADSYLDLAVSGPRYMVEAWD
jgi:glucoamylase